MGYKFAFYLEADSAENLVQRQEHANVEIAKFSITCGDFIKAHFIDDVLKLHGVLREEGDAPFVFIEAGGASDELKDFAGIAATRFSVTFHQLGTGFVL